MNKFPTKNTSSHWEKYKVYYLVGGVFLLLLIFILLSNSRNTQEIKKVSSKLTRLERESGKSPSRWNPLDDLDLPVKNEYSSDFTVPDLKKQDAKWIQESIVSPAVQQKTQNWVNSFKYLPAYRAKFGPEINRHVLLSGPTGSGKSYLADQFCAHESCAWSKVHFETEIYKGSSLKKQKAALANANAYATAEVELAKKENRVPRPAVLVIEEIDSVGIKEMSGIGSPSGRDEVNGLLKMFDEVQNKNLNIVLIATTNYPDALDEALVRPGRFGRRIEVPYLKDEEIEGLVRYFEKVMKDEHGYKSLENKPKWSPKRKDEKKVVQWGTDFWNQVVQETKKIKQQVCKEVEVGTSTGEKVKITPEIGFAFPDLAQALEDCLNAKLGSNQTVIVPDIKDYSKSFKRILKNKKKDWKEKIMRGKPVHWKTKVPAPTKDPEKDPEKNN